MSLAIDRNQSLKIFYLIVQYVANSLIKIVKACNKLSNIQVLQLDHNCIISSKVVELASIITLNTSLERVLLGGITLNATECFHCNIHKVMHKTNMISCDNNTCILSCSHCACLKAMYLVMLKKQIDSDTQCMNNYYYFNYNAKNVYFDQNVYHYFGNDSIIHVKI